MALILFSFGAAFKYTFPRVHCVSSRYDVSSSNTPFLVAGIENAEPQCTINLTLTLNTRTGEALSNHPSDQTTISSPLYPPGTCGPLSRSTSSTFLLPSALSRIRFPKYFLATSLSLFTFNVSARCCANWTTLFSRPARRVSAGKRRILRTSEEMRRELECV